MNSIQSGARRLRAAATAARAGRSAVAGEPRARLLSVRAPRRHRAQPRSTSAAGPLAGRRRRLAPRRDLPLPRRRAPSAARPRSRHPGRALSSASPGPSAPARVRSRAPCLGIYPVESGQRARRRPSARSTLTPDAARAGSSATCRRSRSSSPARSATTSRWSRADEAARRCRFCWRPCALAALEEDVRGFPQRARHRDRRVRHAASRAASASGSAWRARSPPAPAAAGAARPGRSVLGRRRRRPRPHRRARCKQAFGPAARAERPRDDRRVLAPAGGVSARRSGRGAAGRPDRGAGHARRADGRRRPVRPHLPGAARRRSGVGRRGRGDERRSSSPRGRPRRRGLARDRESAEPRCGRGGRGRRRRRCSCSSPPSLELVPPFIVRAIVDDHLLAGPVGRPPRCSRSCISAASAAVQAMTFLYSYLAATIAQGVLSRLRVRLVRAPPAAAHRATSTGRRWATSSAAARGRRRRWTPCSRRASPLLVANLVRLVTLAVGMLVLSPALTLVAAPDRPAAGDHAPLPAGARPAVRASDAHRDGRAHGSAPGEPPRHRGGSRVRPRERSRRWLPPGARRRAGGVEPCDPLLRPVHARHRHPGVVGGRRPAVGRARARRSKRSASRSAPWRRS